MNPYINNTDTEICLLVLRIMHNDLNMLIGVTNHMRLNTPLWQNSFRYMKVGMLCEEVIKRDIDRDFFVLVYKTFLT